MKKKAVRASAFSLSDIAKVPSHTKSEMVDCYKLHCFPELLGITWIKVYEVLKLGCMKHCSNLVPC